VDIQGLSHVLATSYGRSTSGLPLMKALALMNPRYFGQAVLQGNVCVL
jgi:hypothetical protein